MRREGRGKKGKGEGRKEGVQMRGESHNGIVHNTTPSEHLKTELTSRVLLRVHPPHPPAQTVCCC